MNKSEVAEYLGVSQKTVERYVSQGKLSVVYIRKKGYYEKSEVEALFQELNEPIHRSIVDIGSSDLAQINTQVLGHLVAFLANKLQDFDDELAHLENLERCAAHGWHLKSPELKDLVKLKNLPRSPFLRYGFVFERQGRWWRISKNATDRKINI